MSNRTRVNLTLNDDYVEMLDFLAKERFGGVPRSTLVTLLMKRALDQEMDTISYFRRDDGSYSTVCDYCE